jgi:hypothetical protein
MPVGGGTGGAGGVGLEHDDTEAVRLRGVYEHAAELPAAQYTERGG